MAAAVGADTVAILAEWGVGEARLPPKPEPAPPPDDATPDQLEIHRLTLLITKLTEERDQLKKKVQHLTIALAEARGGQ